MPTLNTNGERRRVVVTGLGAVSPLGLTVPDTWAALVAGTSGAAPISRFDASAFSTTFACEVKDFDPYQYVDRKLVKRLDPFMHYGLAAAAEAVEDAGLASWTEDEKDCVGVVFGSGQGGLHTTFEQVESYLKDGPRAFSPFYVPGMISDMAASLISMQYGFRGPTHCVVSACATGNSNIADALAIIQRGEADAVLAGGGEMGVCVGGLGGFSALRALSKRNDAPEKASRPFDVDRDGFVIGEGAGVLVLEALEHAQARGATIYAEVLSVGASADAYHLTAPHPEGRGAALAMTRALEQAGVAPEEVDTINTHGTSTPLGDLAESKAIRAVLGDHAERAVSTSTKSMTGHLLGAAGAVEAIASVLSIRDGIVPPTINLDTPDPACGLRLAANEAVHQPVRVAISNAFGFGGKNTTAVFRAFA